MNVWFLLTLVSFCFLKSSSADVIKLFNPKDGLKPEITKVVSREIDLVKWVPWTTVQTGIWRLTMENSEGKHLEQFVEIVGIPAVSGAAAFVTWFNGKKILMRGAGQISTLRETTKSGISTLRDSYEITLRHYSGEIEFVDLVSLT